MQYSRFQTYFQDTFFQRNIQDFEIFFHALKQPLPRSIRIKPDKIQEVSLRLQQDGWILEPSNIPQVFFIKHDDTFLSAERRIGFTPDHLVGNFYIQELAAAHAVHILADGKIHNDPFLILDISSSPGGKTTQLAEYFPKSFIIANEPTRERIPQLLQNLERMETPNIGITLHPGQHWKYFPETFDRILLDAPCSGEGTLYKNPQVLKNWHIKNINRIALLQKKLIENAIIALKTKGTLLYATCALNQLENENIVTNILNKYPDNLSITFEKKFWPHIDHTGGFFITKIYKKSPIPFISREKSSFRKNTNTQLVPFYKKIPHWNIASDIQLWIHTNKILAVKNQEHVSSLQHELFFMRFGEHIGFINTTGEFTPTARAYRYILPEKYATYDITNEGMIDDYLRGKSVSINAPDGWILGLYRGVTLFLEWCENGNITNTFPKEWLKR